MNKFHMRFAEMEKDNSMILVRTQWLTKLLDCPSILGACVKRLLVPQSRLSALQESQSRMSEIMNYITTKFQVIGSQSPQLWPWGQLKMRDERRSS